MAANKGNEAYDLSLFEAKPAKVVELKPNKKMQKAQQRKNAIQSLLNTSATLLISACVIAVMGLMIFNRVELTKMDRSIDQKQQQLVVLQSENTRLTDELARKTTTKQVEDYASNTLGMQKMEASQIEYINPENADKTVLPQNESGSILDSLISAAQKFLNKLHT